jgi:endonuclease/exonuclease/phosphatase family metal-dependent hydrolase
MRPFRTLVQTVLAAAALMIVSQSPAQAQTCGVALDKTALTVGVGEANWQINVTTAPTCAWNATSDSNWLVVKSTVPTPAVGNGYAKVRAITNTTSPTKRTGHFFVNGIVYTVTQGGCGTSCTDSATPDPAPAPAPITGTTATLRVLQYNTHHGGWGTDGIYSPDRIVDWIVKADPDVVSLNEIEINDSWSKGLDQTVIYRDLLQKRTGVAWYKVYMNRYGSTSGNGNLVLSKYPFIATATRLLSAGRSAADATIDVNGRTINFTSVHLDNQYQSNRIKETAELLSWETTLAENRIVAGDYNAWPGTTEILNMTATYIDTWPAAQAIGAAIGNGITHGSHRIDYIFQSKGATNLKLVSQQIFNTADANGVRPSDHEPVLAVFEVK